jgi:hypothetical protein
MWAAWQHASCCCLARAPGQSYQQQSVLLHTPNARYIAATGHLATSAESVLLFALLLLSAGARPAALLPPAPRLC